MADPELEFSPLGGRVTQDGVDVQVHIYRIVGSEDGWALEVVDPASGTSTAWDEYFATDADAYRMFFEALNDGGVQQFLPVPSGTVH